MFNQITAKIKKVELTEAFIDAWRRRRKVSTK